MSVHFHQAGSSKQRCNEAVPLRAVVFEPAGVFYDPTPRRRWLWQLLTRLGLRLSYDEFVEPWDAKFLPPVHRGEQSYADALHAFLASLGLSPADLSEAEAAMPLRGQPLEAGVRPLPGVARTLSWLSCHGLSLATLCDCSLSGNELKEQLDHLGLGGHFGVVITSADVGSVKPASENYESTATALGLRAEECAIVSVRSSDLRGAHDCRWRTIAFGTLSHAPVDATITSWAQLIEVISEWTAAKLRAAS
jgi:beta-phosphoglucomutase-like phosphatase (HAD superfamily)